MTKDWYDSSQLPAFDSPPVQETAMGFEYPALDGMDVVKLVQLQAAWAADFPLISENPGAMPTSMEPGNELFVGFGDGPRRIWAANPENGLLLQTQADRIILNWRKPFSPTPYPGYASLRGELVARWDLLQSTLSAMDLSAPAPHLAEFTYVNHVPLADGERMSDVLTVVSHVASLPGTESFGSFQFVREVKAGANPFPAQLQIQGQPVQTPEGAMLAFNVTARVLLDGEPERAFDGLDAAHALASHSFAGLVTERKQKDWGRTR